MMRVRLLHIGLFILIQSLSIFTGFGQVRPKRIAQFPLDTVSTGSEIWYVYKSLEASKKSCDSFLKNFLYHGLVFQIPRNFTQGNGTSILSVPDYQINHLDIYGYDSLTGRSNLIIRYGDEISTKEYTSQSRSIQQTMEADKYTHLCVLYSRPGNIPQLPLLIWEQDAYLKYWNRIELGFGILFGLLGTYLLFILFAYFQNKKPLYLLFFLWVLAYCLYYFISSGFLKFYVLPDIKELFSTIRLIIVVFGLYAMSEFALVHYEERKNMKFFVWFWYVFMAITVVLNSYNFYFGVNVYEGYESQFVWLVRVLVLVFLFENIYLPVKHYRKTKQVTYLTYVLLFSSLHFFIYLYQTMFVKDMNFDYYILGVSGLFVFEIISIAIGISVYTIRQKNKKIALIQDKGQIQKSMNLLRYNMRQSERKKIASELHDDVLNRLSMLRSLQKENLLSEEEVNTKLDEISRDIQEYANGLFPRWISTEHLEKLMYEYFDKYLSVQNVKLKIEIDSVTHALEPLQKLQLFRLLQEFVKNSITHGNPTQIEFFANEKNEDQIQIMLREDGKGYRMDEVKKGFGSLSVESRVNSLGGEIQMFSEIGEGVSWSVIIPKESFKQSSFLQTLEPAF